MQVTGPEAETMESLQKHGEHYKQVSKTWTLSSRPPRNIHDLPVVSIRHTDWKIHTGPAEKGIYIFVHQTEKSLFLILPLLNWTYSIFPVQPAPPPNSCDLHNQSSQKQKIPSHATLRRVAKKNVAILWRFVARKCRKKEVLSLDLVKNQGKSIPSASLTTSD